MMQEEILQLDKEFIELFVDLRKRFIEEVKRSFNAFFSGHGFSITEAPDLLKAKQGNVEVILHIPHPRLLSFGSIIVFPVSVRIFTNQYDYNLLVVTPDISGISYSAWYPSGDEKKKKEVELELRELILSNLKNNIDKLKSGNLRYAFFLYEKGKDKREEIKVENFTLSLEEAFQRLLKIHPLP